MTKEQQAYNNISKGWGLVTLGESVLIDLWFDKQNLPEDFRDCFSLNSLAGGEFALDLNGTPITDTWDMNDKIETILYRCLSNYLLPEYSDTYKTAIEIMKAKGIDVIINKES